MLIKKCEYCKKQFSARQKNTYLCDDCKYNRECKCGCGNLVSNYTRYYYSGHNPKSHTKDADAKRGRAVQEWNKKHPVEFNRTRKLQAATQRRKGRWHHTRKPEVRKKNSEAQRALGKHHQSRRPEVKKKISESLRKTLRSPKIRASMARRMRKLHRDYPESWINARAKQSLSHKGQSNKQSKVEKMLYDALDKRMFKYTGLNNEDYGQPISTDILAPRVNLIIQVDGCFWHECPKHGAGEHKEQRGKDRYLTKIAQSKGWTVLRIWEHDIKNDLNGVTKKIYTTYNKLYDKVSRSD